MSLRSSKLLKAILPVVALLAGIAGTAALISARQTPQPEPRVDLGTLVETLDVMPQDLQVMVQGQGEVGARTRVELLPEVSGRVVAVHKNLVSGGRVQAGQTLARIDDRDYQLGVERAKAAVARGQVALERERAEAEAARAEWQALNGDARPPALLVREPQLRQAEAEIAAARADLAAAELALERTRLKVPFDAMVLQDNVDVGQWIGPGRAVATLIGTDTMEIRVPLDNAELRWIEVGTATAQVIYRFADAEHRRPGRVDRLEAQVDPQSRLVHVVVTVDDPFSGSAPLLPGSFAQVDIIGDTLAGVIAVPRSALRADRQVWLAVDGSLRMHQADVRRLNRDLAYLRPDGLLGPGAQIIVSALDAATEGMKIRTTPQTADPSPDITPAPGDGAADEVAK